MRNLHFRRAIKYAVDRKSLLAALGYDDTIPTDLYAADIRTHTDENGTHFRDFFLDQNNKEFPKPLTMTINGFTEKMIYYDYKTIEDIKYEELVARGFSNDDPQYNPELALKEFKIFEEEMGVLGLTQPVYDLKAMLSSSSDEQTQVLIDQYLKLLFNGRVRLSGFFVAPSIVSQYENSRDASYDFVYTRWGYDTPDPFSYLRLWALTQDQSDKGAKYNVAFDSYLVYTTPKGFADPNQFPMMDDMERTMGYPDASNFQEKMMESFGIDWISYEDWKTTKERLLGWQSTHKAARIKARDNLVKQGKISEANAYDVSGVTNTESQILNNRDLDFFFSNSFTSYEGVQFPALSLSKSYGYQAILEAVLKNYAVATSLFQAAISAYASTLIGAYSTGSYFNYSSISYKLSYVCSTPPKVQWSLPGCEAINDTNLPIGGKS